MNSQKIQILQDLKSDLMTELKGNLKDVILFGSQLNENKLDSDYDILVIIKDSNNWRLERLVSDICYDIDLKYNIITDAHIISEAELSTPRGKQPIFVNAIKQGYHA